MEKIATQRIGHYLLMSGLGLDQKRNYCIVSSL